MGTRVSQASWLFAAMGGLLLASWSSAAPPPPAGSAEGSPGGGGQKKPNVLIILADDMNCDLGCYGNKEVQSPNIDKLATEGVLFERAYCQYPLCNPSRASFMTGRRPDATRAIHNGIHFREALPDVVTLPQLFQENGYFVARVGKVYHYSNPGGIGTDGFDDPASWQERYNPSGRDKDEEDLITNFTPKVGLGASLSLMAAEGTDEEQTDGLVTNKVVDLLKQHKDGPFFLVCGYYRPHCPHIAPKKYFDMHPLNRVDMPDYKKGMEGGMLPAAMDSTKPWPWLGVTREQSQLTKQAYWATNSFVDAEVGRLLAEVDKMGLRDNTIIAFWSDHGYHVGDKGLWRKQSLFENSARVPLIIDAPETTARDARCAKPVELLDIYPTIAQLAGLTPPADLDGASLVPLLDNPKDPEWNRPAYTQVWRGKYPGYSVRTARYRYTVWNGGKKGVELYDYEKDPTEDRNVADDPAYAEVRSELQSLVNSHWPGDPVKPRNPEDRKIIPGVLYESK